ncbi:S1C family serine protease [Halostagnicola kamekurae]|uniref:Serine protease, S1-C subfamily, contains C-terminal PDZ domain n=1 Tax=Halostagnicola kamekurae TaxID=619731 RepID=A0A1I6RNT6_9EURY|nr:trypsin-like peptidase domain-containing protein [Halostagnicola kamekurae]SFS66413.1 serine protease, S1-C subfamily, contains C-terminal PDZ domain [Halostagnicola kamekurae]
MRNQRTTRRTVLGLVGSAVATGSVASLSGAAQDDGGSSSGQDSNQQPTDGADATEESPYTALYEQTRDGLVLVRVSGDEQGGGIGSGFVYEDEYIVTNEHVVATADELDVQFVEEDWRSASVVGTDPYSDLAVLEPEGLPEYAESLTVADTIPEIGRQVVALGNPLGLDASVSHGIVSGVNRSLPSPTGVTIPAAIQTDAPVNPGNSGGPLVTLEGADVVGVVSAGAGPGLNIGLAISAALLERVGPALIEDGTYEHPFLGVSVVPLSPRIAQANDIDEPGGVLVVETVPDSPADGVLEAADGTTVVDGEAVPVGGDVIVELAGEAVPNQDALSARLALETSPGETIDITVVRDGERIELEVTLAARDDS